MSEVKKSTSSAKKATAPQDHKAKATKPTLFEFTVAAKVYTLPSAEEGAPNIPGWITSEALMQPDDTTAQLRLGVAMLSVCEVSAPARAALRTLNTEQLFIILNDWMDNTAKNTGVSLPQS